MSEPMVLPPECPVCGDEWQDDPLPGEIPGDVPFNPGGYLPRIIVRCQRCHAEHVFYVNWEGADSGPGVGPLGLVPAKRAS